MKSPRVRFTLRRMMVGVDFLALILTVILQGIQLRKSAVREQQLLAAARLSAARAAWVTAVNQSYSIGGMPKAGERWAAGIDFENRARAVEGTSGR